VNVELGQTLNYTPCLLSTRVEDNSITNDVIVNWDPELGLSDSPDVVIFDGMAFERQVSAQCISIHNELVLSGMGENQDTLTVEVRSCMH
jgi:hypothetical protein